MTATTTESSISTALTPTSASGWRRFLKVHPSCDTLPLLPPDQLRELADDIKRHGMREPIVLHATVVDGVPTDLLLLDGRNRLDALELLGRPIFAEPLTTPVRLHDKVWWQPVVCDLKKIPAEVVSRNIRRRHLSEKDRVELALKVITAAAHSTNGAGAPIRDGSPIGAPSAIAPGPDVTWGEAIKAAVKKPIVGDRGRLKGSTKSTVGVVAEIAGVDPKTARKHLAGQGIVQPSAKPAAPAKAAPPSSASSPSKTETEPITTPRPAIQAAAVLLQTFSDRKDLQRRLRDVLDRAQLIGQRHPQRRAEVGVFCVRIADAFADDSIVTPVKKAGRSA